MAESRIAEAIEYIQLNPHAKIAPIARSFNVPYQKLRARLIGRNPSSSRGGHNKKLSEPQETALKDYMMLLYHSGTPGTIEVLIQAANRLLYYSGINDTVSHRWAKRWIVRNKEYWKLVRPKPISVQRRQAHIQEDIKAYFEEFKRCCQYWGILEEDISNFDETGFQIGVISGGRVIVLIDCKAAFISDPENRELVTAVATINWGGQRVPPMIIFKGAYYLRKHFDNNMDLDIL
ncbi:hypothetical protein B7463_g4640, partial [Scytalidium lignicola]